MRKIAYFLRWTPFHPQWFAFRLKEKARSNAISSVRGCILDIGSADQEIARQLGSDCRYTGLDLLSTSTELYGTRPDVFGDAQHLPFQPKVFDSVLLLDVIEHLPDPKACLGEIFRVLRPGGRVFLSFPFAYPLHDRPFDYWRISENGIKHLAACVGLKVRALEPRGASIESAALLLNLSLAEALLICSGRFRGALLLIPVLAVFVLLTNLLAWTSARLLPNSSFLPVGYWAILESDDCNDTE